MRRKGSTMMFMVIWVRVFSKDFFFSFSFLFLLLFSTWSSSTLKMYISYFIPVYVWTTHSFSFLSVLQDEFEHMMNEWTWSFIVGAGYVLTIQLAYWMVLMFRCCWCRGQGPGKYVLGLQVVDTKGTPVSCCTMFVRSMIKMCGFVLFPFIFWLSLFRKDYFYY